MYYLWHFVSWPLQVFNALRFFVVMSEEVISAMCTTITWMTRSNCVLQKMSANIVSCCILLPLFIWWMFYLLAGYILFNVLILKHFPIFNEFIQNTWQSIVWIHAKVCAISIALLRVMFHKSTKFGVKDDAKQLFTRHDFHKIFIIVFLYRLS